MKKLISLLCALALVLAMGGSALADLATVESMEVVVEEGAVIYNRMSPDMIPVTVTANMSNGKTKDVTKNTVISGDLSAPGTCELTASYSRNGQTAEATFTVDVQESIFVSEAVPAEYRGEVEQKGTVEHLEYPTHAYDDAGNVVSDGVNECYVYLPYGYDAEQDYNVLYLMHGGGESAGYWFAQGPYAPGGEEDLGDETFTVEVLDNLIAKGYCAPLIVVTPCIKTDNEHGFNGVSSFQYEFKNDLVPAVEAAYATYANGDVSPENLIATRDHRAYDGLSMGSITGWSSILMGCTDYVSYVGNFSGCRADVPAIAEHHLCRLSAALLVQRQRHQRHGPRRARGSLRPDPGAVRGQVHRGRGLRQRPELHLRGQAQQGPQLRLLDRGPLQHAEGFLRSVIPESTFDETSPKAPAAFLCQPGLK